MKVVLQTKRDLTQSDRQSIYDAIFMFDYGLKSYHFINSDNYSLELSDISQKHITQPEPQQVRGCETCEKMAYKCATCTELVTYSQPAGGEEGKQ